MQVREPRPKKKASTQLAAPEDFVGFWINRASRTIARVMDARLRPTGLAMSQLPVLRALGEGGALSQKELSRIARVEQPTMAEMLGRMERDGLVQRVQNPDDKRGTLTSLSRTARARFSEVVEALVAGERDAMAGFSNEEKVLFVQFLKRVVNNLEGAS